MDCSTPRSGYFHKNEYGTFVTCFRCGEVRKLPDREVTGVSHASGLKRALKWSRIRNLSGSRVWVCNDCPGASPLTSMMAPMPFYDFLAKTPDFHHGGVDPSSEHGEYSSIRIHVTGWSTKVVLDESLLLAIPDDVRSGLQKEVHRVMTEKINMLTKSSYFGSVVVSSKDHVACQIIAGLRSGRNES